MSDAGSGGNAGLENPVMSEARLRWQCRRGMRELDELLLRYLERRYAGAGSAEKCAFEAFLDLPDPELAGYLLYRQLPESPALVSLVHSILGDAAR